MSTGSLSLKMIVSMVLVALVYTGLASRQRRRYTTTGRRTRRCGGGGSRPVPPRGGGEMMIMPPTDDHRAGPFQYAGGRHRYCAEREFPGTDRFSERCGLLPPAGRFAGHADDPHNRKRRTSRSLDGRRTRGKRGAGSCAVGEAGSAPSAPVSRRKSSCRSTDGTITTSDTEVGTDAVTGLAPSGSDRGSDLLVWRFSGGNREGDTREAPRLDQTRHLTGGDFAYGEQQQPHFRNEIHLVGDGG